MESPSSGGYFPLGPPSVVGQVSPIGVTRCNGGETTFQRFSTGLFASGGQIAWNRFTGPGRVGLQSMYLHMPTAVGGVPFDVEIPGRSFR